MESSPILKDNSKKIVMCTNAAYIYTGSCCTIPSIRVDSYDVRCTYHGNGVWFAVLGCRKTKNDYKQKHTHTDTHVHTHTHTLTHSHAHTHTRTYTHTHTHSHTHTHTHSGPTAVPKRHNRFSCHMPCVRSSWPIGEGYHASLCELYAPSLSS